MSYGAGTSVIAAALGPSSPAQPPDAVRSTSPGLMYLPPRTARPQASDQKLVTQPGGAMSKNILLAVDAASGEPDRHVAAAAAMTRELARDTGDHVIVLHVHEFTTGRFGRIQVDCGEGEGEGVVKSVVSDLEAAGVSAEGEISETHVGHIASAILKAANEHDARLLVL